MARKESVTKNDILEAAFSILQEEGIEQVTARKLAARANCSTQPIFRIYKNINELIEELFFKSCGFFQDYYRAFPRAVRDSICKLRICVYLICTEEQEDL